VTDEKPYNPDEQRYRDERMAEICRDRDEIVDEFLSWASVNRLSTEYMVQAFDRWCNERWSFVPLSPAERGMLLFYVTHTEDGKTRVLLANARGQGDKFTSATEPPRVTAALARRAKPGGDLAKQPGESDGDYLRRMVDAYQALAAPPRHIHHEALPEEPPFDVPPEAPSAEVEFVEGLDDEPGTES
jgi:hypothetical protein